VGAVERAMSKSSLYADSLVALFEVLSAAPYPGREITVALGGFPGDNYPSEWVTVLTTAPIDEQQDWASVGCDSHDEQFLLTVDIGTVIPGRDPRDALDRLNELSSTVEAAVRGSSGAAGSTQPELIADRLMWWHPVAVDPWIGPRSDGEGYDASCAITVGVRARI
jgi:hypothetical protein